MLLYKHDIFNLFVKNYAFKINDDNQTTIFNRLSKTAAADDN